ncbi:MAG: hypothetical protein KBE23_08560 [Chloroflexi bacterium]|nr:hypothetical protein [Chloroflexota bacterium]MBP7042784.1 hypothetical protein [Chloroflexota bacterium]
MFRRTLVIFALAAGMLLTAQFFTPPVLAATCTWTGASTDWADAGNWANCSGVVPGGADTAVIPATANDPILSADADIGTLTIQPGAIVTINTAVTLTAGSLNLSGTLTGAGNITISLAATWAAGGVMSGSGETHIMGSATFDLSAYSVDLIGRTLRNEGAMTWTGPSTIWATAGAAFINEAAGTINAQATAGNLEWHGNGLPFQNDGAITVNGVNDYGLIIGGALSNDGSVTLQNSWLRMQYGSTSSGDFLGGSGTYLFVGDNYAPTLQNFTFSPGSNITIEYVYFSYVGTVNVSGYYDASGANGRTTITSSTGGSTLNFTPDATIVSLGNRLDISGNPTVNLSSGSPISVPRIEQTGTLTGTDTMTVTSLYNWSAGTLGGSGMLTLAEGATMYPRGTVAKSLNGRTLTNHGTIAWLQTGAINGSNGAILDNYGSFDARDNATFNGEADVVFNNYNTIIKSGGTQTTTLDIVVNNYGIIRPESGQIAFTYGDVALPPASATNLNGGSLEVDGLLDIQGGALTGSGTILGDVQNGGQIAPGESPGNITIQGSYTQTVSGTLTMELGISAQDFLTVTGTAALTGTLEINLLEGYTPAPPDSFRVLAYTSHTGTFGALLLPTLSGGLGWDVVYEPDGVYVQVAQKEFYLYLPIAIKP